jgi:hypothetical protein
MNSFKKRGLIGNLIIDLGEEFDVSYNIETDVEEVIDDDDLKLLNSSEIPVHLEEDYNSELPFEDSDDDLDVGVSDEQNYSDEYF